MEKHSVTLSGHPTSISIEREFWDILKKIAKNRNQTMNSLISDLDKKRQGNLSSAIRLFVLREVQLKSEELFYPLKLNDFTNFIEF